MMQSYPLRLACILVVALSSVGRTGTAAPLGSSCIDAACAGYFSGGVRDSCCADNCCTSCDCWFGQVDAIFLSRTTGRDQVAVIRVAGEGNAGNGSTVLTTGDADYRFQPGVRFLVGRQLDECRAWEASYFGIFNWHGSATATGNNNLAIPGDLGLASLDFFAADTIRLDTTARLHNAELNYVWSRDYLWLLAGFRYVSLNEQFNIRSTDADTGTSDYNIQANNNLFGGQLGARLKGSRDRWGWEGTGKAGIYGNYASGTQLVTDFPAPFVLRNADSSASGNVAFVGDLNLSLTYQVNDVWSLRGGYNLLWIEGVALASNQLDFTDTPSSGTTLQTGGGLFAHGLNLGVEACW